MVSLNGHMMPNGTMMQGMTHPGMMEPAVAPYAPPSPNDIMEMTNTHERDTEPLRQRMEDDHDRYLLKSHVNRDTETKEPLPNYAVYTSNRWRVFADKVISWQTLAEQLIRVKHVEAGGHPEETDNHKERFAIGSLRAADERLSRFMQPTLRGAQAFYATVRGGYIGGRSLLVNRPDGKAYPDITAWDPMHIHWGLGPEGLGWASYKVKKTRAQIRAEYGINMQKRGFSFPGFRAKGDTSEDAEKSGIWTYDFYDNTINTCLLEGGEVLKSPMLHGSPRVPVYLSLVGPQPMLQSERQSQLIASVGESVYAPVREVGDKINSIMSIFLEIVERARRQTIVLESRDGKKTLKGDPFKEATAIATATGEKIYTLELQKMATETVAFIQIIDGEWQRGSLPHSSYGETPFQLSGFAITQLRQATETVLASRIQVHESNYTQIVNLLYDQFMTGRFGGMHLSGTDSNRSYFSVNMTPEMLENSCDYSVRMVSQLPQDDASRWQQAEIAKRTELLSDEDILNDVLQREDAQQTLDKMNLQKAQKGLPEAILYTLGQAAADRGDMTLAQAYLMEFNRLMAQKWGLMPPTNDAGPAGNEQPGQQQKKPGGPLPQVSPHAMSGAPPEPETSNDGPSRVAPGTPRPGAQGQPQ